jgi:hypothetical protein
MALEALKVLHNATDDLIVTPERQGLHDRRDGAKQKQEQDDDCEDATATAAAHALIYISGGACHLDVRIRQRTSPAAK